MSTQITKNKACGADKVKVTFDRVSPKGGELPGDRRWGTELRVGRREKRTQCILRCGLFCRLVVKCAYSRT